jgi:crossover junction endodeoxyribonuclease RusA
MITIKVYGLPAPQGSKRHVGHGVMVESSKAVGPWRERIAHETQSVGKRIQKGAVEVDITFYLPRPKGHYGTGRNSERLKDSAPSRPETTPDVDKLGRAVLDGLVEGGALRNDSQVADLYAHKYYATENFPPGCLIIISELK